ncbi:MAG: (2Fe-2S)-binding protein [Candidatus Obscuribacterales bacterium]|nr:(2Fe-2S)-binding protein [Candidatus Obscuribacterales bacterium]
MFICNCAAVGHAAIVKAVEQDGVRTVKQLQIKLNVANQCKKCAIAAQVIIKLVLAAMAANKKAGIKAPVQLHIDVMLQAIAAAERAKRPNARAIQRTPAAKIAICDADTCTCGNTCR